MSDIGATGSKAQRWWSIQCCLAEARADLNKLKLKNTVLCFSNLILWLC